MFLEFSVLALHGSCYIHIVQEQFDCTQIIWTKPSSAPGMGWWAKARHKAELYFRKCLGSYLCGLEAETGQKIAGADDED
ncbi:hypothetical protein BTVI_156990 [Pitangus sulphuratus]|nr:hypothetical protein BTVI_156990 [Pitangus sulphuratus]